MNLPQVEEDVLKFWEENKIFEKSVEKDAPQGDFIFYEGPPTANGRPGLHHVLARAFKDVIPRYKTMKGCRVERKAGWDTHGLPVELQVEKALGLKNKQDIENIVPGNSRESIIEFNKKCKESVWVYKDLWEKMTRRMGYWVDMDHPYVTYENKYIESVWWVIAQIWKTKNKKGESLIYKGHKVVPYCYRCGTALSSHEVAQGYQKVKDTSVFVKFRVRQKGETDNDHRYFLVWTTTSWTLPGNVALAVGKDIQYVEVLYDDKEKYILAKDLLDKVIPEDDYDIISEFDGEDLIGKEYEPLYETNDTDKKAYCVVTGDFVTTQEGTGIVHIAPAFGADDNEVGKEYSLPTLVTVDIEGRIDADVPGKGILVKKKNDKGNYAVDDLIIEDLSKRGLLFRTEKYEHDYPFCWRCDTPLIYYAKPSWFIRMSELSEELVKNNQNINWIPEHIKEGRFGEWLRDVKDWAISRERYWGTPLPVWECQFKKKSENSWEIGCGNTEVISSIRELEKKSGKKLDDLHKPYIDDISWKCKCGGTMERVSEVMDVWFDSGSMPLAQFHYPDSATAEDKEKIESGKFFPADYISEAIDQTRGWFYTLHAIATLLNQNKKVPEGFAFRNVICLGHILDAKGKKMSKSRGNIVEPMEIMDEYGADMLRWMLYTINQPGLPKKFDVKGMRDIMNRVFRMLWNSYYFFVMYANVDKVEIKNDKLGEKNNLLDRWIISETQLLIKEVDEKLAAYDVYGAAKPIEKFVDNLSNWYIRRSRRRFWKSESDSDKKQAYETLHYVLITLSKLMAPFTPFISEEIFRNLTQPSTSPIIPLLMKEREDTLPSPLEGEGATAVAGADEVISVHLENFPIADKELIDEKLNEEMAKVRDIITQGLQLRAAAKIKVRQPLSAVSIKYLVSSMELENIIKEELNVKEVVVNEKQEEEINLDTNITEELKLEGVAREIIRHIQEMRKEAGYEVDNRIKIGYSGWSEVFGNPELKSLIAKETLADDIAEGEIEKADLQKKFDLEKKTVEITIRKIVF